jgi:hypothetical protein
VTLALIRRDPCFRGLFKWLLVAPMTCSVLMGVIGLLFYRLGPGFLQQDIYRATWLLGVVWLPMALFLLLGRTGVRCSDFDMALPITAKRLWLTHTISVFLSVLAIAIASIGIVALHDLLRQRLTDGAFPNLGAPALIFPTAAGLALAVIILQSRDPSLRTIRRSRAALWSAIVVIMGIFGLIVVLGVVSAFWMLVPVIAALVLGSRFIRTVPATFTIVPREPDGAGDLRAPGARDGGGHGWAAVQQRRERRGAAARWRVAMTVLSVLSRGVPPGALIKVSLLPVLGAPIMLFWGFFMSGFFFEGSFSELDAVIITAYVLFAFVGGPMEQLYFPYTVPVSRRQLFALIVLPGLVVLGAGYTVGKVWMAVDAATTEAIVYQTEPSDSVFPPYPFETPMLRVPIEYCAVAGDGDPPEIRAPWGETHEAFSVDVSRLEDARLYTPFGTPEGSSIDFVAWQISRAVEVVHGISIPPEEIRVRYLATDDEGRVVPSRSDGLTLLQDYPELRAPGRVPTAPLAWLGVAGLFFLMVGAYSRTFRATISIRGRKWVFFGILFGALAIHIVQFATNIIVTKPYVSAGILKIGLGGLTRDLPGGELLLWGVCGAVVAACCWIAQRQFNRIEVPLPSSFTRG